MMNHVSLMGRLTRDPELRRTGSGIAVASFTIAVDRDFSGGDGKGKETDFINCVAWRQTGEFVSKYFTKGRMIALCGRIQVRNFTDKEGNKRQAVEVVAESCYFADSKKDGGNAAPNGANNGAPAGGNNYGTPAGGNNYTAPAGSNNYAVPSTDAYGAGSYPNMGGGYEDFSMPDASQFPF